jgi:DNA-binding XRE family transcriptional regulator
MREMIDATAHEVIMAAVARGEQEMLGAEETVAAPTPLAFWRVRRGLTQKQPSQTAGVSQSYVAGLEAGRRKGDAALLERLAHTLRLRMEDLVAEEVLAEPASRPKKEIAP